MTKHLWTDLAQTAGSRQADRRDEFGPEVEAAIAELRARHGLDDGPNAAPVADPGDPRLVDTLRSTLRDMVPGVNRRGFLQLTGASAVFGLAGCWHQDPDTIVPYREQPEGTTLGKPVWWSSVLRDSGRPLPVTVKTYDGRPIKLEGNPDDPHGRGRLDARTQAALLNLYDPDRAQTGPLRKQGGAALATLSWDDLDKLVGEALKTGNVGLITGPIDGPASRQLIEDLVGAFGGRLKHAAFEAFAQDTAIEARRLCFGPNAAKPPVYHAERAAVMLCLGSDFIGGGHTGLYEAVGFGEQRKLQGVGAKAEMGQLICFEPMLSQTGMSADVRVRARMSEMAGIAWAIAAEVADKLGKGRKLPAGAVPGTFAGTVVVGTKEVETTDDHGHASKRRENIQQSAITFAAEQLVAANKAGKTSLVYVGGATHGGANSLALYVAANYLNALLGNEGVTVETASVPASAIPASAEATLAVLGSCETLIIAGANPAYSLPGAAAALKKAKLVVVLADRVDETFAAASTAVLAPSLHGLESWGDAEPRAGVFAVQQPCIAPLWDARAAEESLMAFVVAGGFAPKHFQQTKASGPDPRQVAVVTRTLLWQAAAKGVQSWRGYVLAAWLKTVKPASGSPADERTFWNSALARGVVTAAVTAKPVAVGFDDAAVDKAKAELPASGGFELVLSASRSLHDGAWANNAWLQELPDPVSKVTWDNYVSASPADFAAIIAALGVDPDRQGYDTPYKNPLARLKVGTAEVLLPVHFQEGQQPGTLEVFFGWGRAAGQVCTGAGAGEASDTERLGVNAFDLLGQGRQAWGRVAKLEAANGNRYRLAVTQGRNLLEGMESGPEGKVTRSEAIAPDDVLSEHRKDARHLLRGHAHEPLNATGTDGQPHGSRQGGNLSMWHGAHIYPGRRWGMVIDLNSCTGCGACIVACSAENNVPVVGRDQVRIGREMHWMRIDRYFSSGDDDRQGNERQFLDVEAVSQPMVCQQCLNAPCEEVCPATATMHNEEGINVQVYNRCIGTRYCSNNCPYKVRRFNFYEYSKYRTGPQNSGDPFNRIAKNLVTEHTTSGREELTRAPLAMMLNPAVTVRSKGVMEKCNFCVQRTRDVRETEKASGKPYADGSVTTACAQTCPTAAITFGDINDPYSAVSQTALAALHGFKVLDKDLNTRPSVLYTRRVRNRPLRADDTVVDAKAH